MRTFDPWIGSHHWDKGLSGVRVLLLGESHYGDVGRESSTFTNEVVREWGQQQRHRFFTITQKLILGLGNGWISDRERSGFWERVAFYNFVQSFPGPGPRHRPTNAAWEAASDPFLSTLQELEPQLLVVLGLELSRHLPRIPQRIRVCIVKHPSSPGFRLREWQPVVSEALADLHP